MHRPVVFFLALLALGMGTSSLSQAAVKSYDDLSAVQMMALQESDGRLLNDDRALESLQNELIHHKISRREFALEDRELTACITEEAAFQNAVLTKQSTFSEHSLAVLRTIGKYTLGISAAILEGILKGGGNFSP
jgi:hypothetical protein